MHQLLGLISPSTVNSVPPETQKIDSGDIELSLISFAEFISEGEIINEDVVLSPTTAFLPIDPKEGAGHQWVISTPSDTDLVIDEASSEEKAPKVGSVVDNELYEAVAPTTFHTQNNISEPVKHNEYPAMMAVSDKVELIRTDEKKSAETLEGNVFLKSSSSSSHHYRGKDIMEGDSIAAFSSHESERNNKNFNNISQLTHQYDGVNISINSGKNAAINEANLNVIRDSFENPNTQSISQPIVEDNSINFTTQSDPLLRHGVFANKITSSEAISSSEDTRLDKLYDPLVDNIRPVIKHIDGQNDVKKILKPAIGSESDFIVTKKNPVLAENTSIGIEGATLENQEKADNFKVIPTLYNSEAYTINKENINKTVEFSLPKTKNLTVEHSVKKLSTVPLMVDDGIASSMEIVSRSGSIGSSAPASPTAPANQTIITQQVNYQISQAINSTNLSEIEIRLDPEELGKVRLVMSPRDGVMMVSVMAERPETLELIRRNSDQLTANMEEIGYENTKFDFKDEEKSKHDSLPKKNELQELDFDKIINNEKNNTIVSQIKSTGLDLRI